MKELIEKSVNQFLQNHALPLKARVLANLMRGVDTADLTTGVLAEMSPEKLKDIPISAAHAAIQIGPANAADKRSFVTILRSYKDVTHSEAGIKEEVLEEIASLLMIHGVGHVYNTAVEAHNQTAADGDKYPTVIIKPM